MLASRILSLALLLLAPALGSAKEVFVYDELRMVVTPNEPEPATEVKETSTPPTKSNPVEPAEKPPVTSAAEVTSPSDSAKPCVGKDCVQPPKLPAPDFKSISLAKDRKQAFIDYFGPQAVSLQKATGYPASLMLSQWAEESGWGSSSNFRALNNIAGHRCWKSGARNQSKIEIPGFEREIQTQCVPGTGGKILYLKFESPLDATLSYMQNLLYNEGTARAYRSIRAEVTKQKEQGVDWKKLMPGLKSYCPHAHYQRNIPNLLRRNNLELWEKRDLCSCY